MKIAIMEKINSIYPQIEKQVRARATKASGEMRKALVETMRGQASGRVYKKVGTYGRTRSKATKSLLGDYGHKLRGGQLYRSSAPGSPPAVRSGDLRDSFEPIPHSEGANTVASIESQLNYATYLEDGTHTKTGSVKMLPRPYMQATLDKAMPKVMEVYKKPYHIKI